MVHRARFNFMAEARIWYSQDPEQKSLPSDCRNLIVLSDEFYKEISSHPIPTDLEAAKALSASPAALDLFIWLSYRCFTARGRSGCHYSASTGSFANSAALTMRDRASFARSWNVGWTWSAQCGRNAPLRSIKTALA